MGSGLGKPPLSPFRGLESKGLCLFRNKATRRPTMAPTTSYSSSTATVSALSARGARLFLFSRKAVDLVAVTGRRAPGLGRAGLREARSGPGAGAGGWCLPPGRLRLRSGPGPTAGQVWDARAGLRGPHLAPSCLPGRCPHGAGPVRKAHRLGHQAGEPGCPLLSRGWGVGPSVLPPPPLWPVSDLPLPSAISWVSLHSPSTETHTLSALEKYMFPLTPQLSCLSGWGDSGDGSR